MGMSVNVVALLLVLAAMSSSSSLLFADAAFRARVFKVGGEDGWVVSPSEPLNHWSERQRFRKFDRLYFRYKAGEDSVLLVSKAAYQICNRTNPVNSFTDGKTLIELPHSGPLYFISGQPGHCEKGQKLIVRVLADRTPAPSSHSPAISPSQPPSAPSRAPTPHHPGKAPTAPPPSSPLSPPAAAPAVPASPAAPSPQAGAPAPAPNASGASLSASFGVAGLAAMVIGWMVMA